MSKSSRLEGFAARGRPLPLNPGECAVLQWLVEAAEQLKAFTSYFLCDLHVTQLQLDELYAVLRGVKDGEISEANALKRLEPTRPWVWTTIDPVSKLLLSLEVGLRTWEMAQRVVHQVARRLASTCMPLWLSDGFKCYLPPLWATLACGFTPSVAKTKARGQSHAGCRGLVCSMRRSSSNTGVSMWLGSSTGWHSARLRRSSKSWRCVAGRSIHPLWSGSTSTFASAWRWSGGGSTRCARAKTAWGRCWNIIRNPWVHDPLMPPQPEVFLWIMPDHPQPEPTPSRRPDSHTGPALFCGEQLWNVRGQ